MPKGVKTSVQGQEAGLGREVKPLGVGGNVSMKADEVLRLLEKHEEECNRRYAKIEKSLDSLDYKLWGLAILILGTVFLPKMIL